MFGNALEPFFKAFIILAVLSPLGLWKLVEIIIWLFKHVKISFGS